MSSRFSERACLRQLEWNAINKETQHWLLNTLMHMYACVHLQYMNINTRMRAHMRAHMRACICSRSFSLSAIHTGGAGFPKQRGYKKAFENQTALLKSHRLSAQPSWWRSTALNGKRMESGRRKEPFLSKGGIRPQRP